MGQRHREEDGSEEPDLRILTSECRRAYYRISGFLPLRLTPLAPHEIDAAIFDLSLPDPLLASLEDADDCTPLMVRLRRIEEKLDLLLGTARIEVPRQLSGRDRQSVVFSGSGLSLDVTWSFEKGDVYLVEVLLPSPYSRSVRSVAVSVKDSPREAEPEALRMFALELRHMEPEDRDALIAYSYDLQRIALRAQHDEERDPC